MNPTLQLVFDGIFVFGMVAYWMTAFFLLYHLIRYGVGVLPKRIAAVFLAGSLFLSLVAVLLFNEANLSGSVNNLAETISSHTNNNPQP